MLVCNVSLRPSRRAIAAELAELAAALDNPGTGNVVFATLVDDPASVGETVDAYLGEIMVEAASAGDIAAAGLVYIVGLDEGTIATAAPSATIGTGTPVTTTSATATGPLFVFDTTFASPLLTVINVGL